MNAMMPLRRMWRMLSPYRGYVTFWVIAVCVACALLAALGYLTGIFALLVPGAMLLFAIWALLAWMPFISDGIMKPLGLYIGSEGFSPGGPTVAGFVVAIAVIIAAIAVLEWFIRR